MAGLAFLNGRVLTQDPARPQAEALAISEGRITAVGSRAEVEAAIGPETRRIDLGGRALIPGFEDAHAHVWKLGQLLTGMLDLRGVESLPALQAALRDFAARRPQDDWLQGRGFNETQMREGRLPTAADLDAAVADRPVVLTRTCGHAIAVNSRALERAGLRADADAPPGGRIHRGADGRPTGVFYDTAMGLVTLHVPLPTAAEYEAMVRAAARHQLERGITSTSDCGVRPELLQVYRDMDQSGKLEQRVNVMPLRRLDGVPGDLPLPERHTSDRLRVDTIKIWADGGMSSATAALCEPYRHTESRGVHRLEEAELLALMKETHAAGWRLAIHAIGDAAIERVLSAYENMGEDVPRRRHRVEHLALPEPAHLERAARLKLVAVPQTVFIHSLGENFRRYLPDRLLGRAYPVRSMLRAGIAVALSSDAPVVEEDDPLLGIRAAIERRDREGRPIAPAEAITAAEAVRAYTLGGAFAAGAEESRGSLTPGKWADLAVLSADPLAVEPAALSEIAVDMTIVGGEVVFER